MIRTMISQLIISARLLSRDLLGPAPIFGISRPLLLSLTGTAFQDETWPKSNTGTIISIIYIELHGNHIIPVKKET